MRARDLPFLSAIARDEFFRRRQLARRRVRARVAGRLGGGKAAAQLGVAVRVTLHFREPLEFDSTPSRPRASAEDTRGLYIGAASTVIIIGREARVYITVNAKGRGAGRDRMSANVRALFTHENERGKRIYESSPR